MKTQLTTEQIKRVKQSIVETERLLNKQLSFSKDLQKTDMIEFYQNHIIKLNDMLLNGWNAPVLN